ncbi:MAG: ABC transporter substrate-binding protein [Candidatus Binatia bacterium]
MRITITGIALCAMLFALCLPAQAQQPAKLPRIGFVSGADADPKHPTARLEAFRQALRDLGYIEGKNILVEYRSTEKRDQFPQLVADLVQLKVDVLVVRPQPAIRAAKQATKTIPIVMVTTQDPVALGFINSLARPGGNITGVTTLQRELSGKRLELLKEVLPRISRVAALMNAASIGDFKMYEAPARALKIQLQPVGVRGPNPDLEDAFQTAVKGRANAIITITNAALNPYAKRIADLAIKNRLPLMGERRDYVEAGGLMSYSADEAASYRRAAIYVDKILKGAQPADLPVEQPTEFELVINFKTSKRIGLTIPPNVLARTDKVIK